MPKTVPKEGEAVRVFWRNSWEPARLDRVSGAARNRRYFCTLKESPSYGSLPFASYDVRTGKIRPKQIAEMLSIAVNRPGRSAADESYREKYERLREDVIKVIREIGK